MEMIVTDYTLDLRNVQIMDCLTQQNNCEATGGTEWKKSLTYLRLKNSNFEFQ